MVHVRRNRALWNQLAREYAAAQLATARRLQRQHGVHFPLLLADAEALPLADARFDLAISEYGAATWCDPHRWIPEAARVLRPGGQLVLLHTGVLLMLAMNELENQPAGENLLRPYFGMHRFEWPDSDGVEFNLGFGDWIRLFRASGLDVIDLVEVRPPEGVTTRFGFVTPGWARRWPSEQVWKLRRRPA